MAKPKIKVIEIRDFKIVAPADGLCHKCAVDHAEEQPHNQQSLHWQYYFYQNNGRWPTWEDAMAHCTPEVKRFWIEELGKRGVKVEFK